MAQSVSINVNAGIGGLSINGNFIRTGNNAVSISQTLPLADSGAITTGVIAITGTPTVVTGTVDVFWTITGVNYRRYGCTATLSGNNLTVSGGAGDTLPTGGQAVTVQNWTSITDVGFDGTQLKAILIQCSQRCCVQFLNGAASTLLAVDVQAGNEVYMWTTGTSPIADIVASIKAVNAAVGAASLVIGALLT